MILDNFNDSLGPNFLFTLDVMPFIVCTKRQTNKGKHIFLERDKYVLEICDPFYLVG